MKMNRLFRNRLNKGSAVLSYHHVTVLVVNQLLISWIERQNRLGWAAFFQIRSFSPSTLVIYFNSRIFQSCVFQSLEFVPFRPAFSGAAFSVSPRLLVHLKLRSSFASERQPLSPRWCC